jgi:hypothetical protein
VASPATAFLIGPRFGPTLLFSLASFPRYRVLQWTELDGTRELLVLGDDYGIGAANVASDGKDLVWIQGEGLDPESSHFPIRWIMTSKYSTNPSAIQPRRLLRWLETPISGVDNPPTVGCGYAAFHVRVGHPAITDKALQIVRLRDGVSWWIPSVSLFAPHDHWHSPIAITCDEVFAVYKGNPFETIRRVRLDSLGPGTPPTD